MLMILSHCCQWAVSEKCLRCRIIGSSHFFQFYGNKYYCISLQFEFLNAFRLVFYKLFANSAVRWVFLCSKIVSNTVQSFQFQINFKTLFQILSFIQFHWIVVKQALKIQLTLLPHLRLEPLVIIKSVLWAKIFAEFDLIWRWVLILGDSIGAKISAKKNSIDIIS